MEWYWIVYWAGYPISWVALIVYFGGDSVEKRKVAYENRAKAVVAEWNDWTVHRESNEAEIDYYKSLFSLVLGPFFFSLFWPAVAVFAPVVAAIAIIGWGLDAVLSLFIKAPKTEEAPD